MAEKRAPAQAVAIDLAVPCAAWRRVLPRAGELAITAARAALTKAGARLRRAELSLVLADDATVAALNERWRHRSGPTNVLAFPGGGRSNAAAPLLLGDVILAFETVALRKSSRQSFSSPVPSHRAEHRGQPLALTLFAWDSSVALMLISRSEQQLPTTML